MSTKQEQAEELEGTCMVCSPGLELLANELGIYCCDVCGWWHHEEDIYNIVLCTDCYNEKTN